LTLTSHFIVTSRGTNEKKNKADIQVGME
jgi:hypothetical protein